MTSDPSAEAGLEPWTRAEEIRRKIALVREALAEQGLAAARLRGVDWFAWITGGASSVVILTAEAGVAEVLVTAGEALALTDAIEEPRMRAEELAHAEGVLEIKASPWAEPEEREALVRRAAGGGRVASDRPGPGEEPLPAAIVRARRRVEGAEVDRYRRLGRDAAAAMAEAMNEAAPAMSELELAGWGARSLLARGIEPTLVLVAGAERGRVHRHPVPTREPLGDRAMMVFCGRRHGLYANLTRFVTFGDPPDEFVAGFQRLARVEAAAFAASRPGARLDAIYGALRDVYAEIGAPDEIFRHHQGGTTGYLSREAVARPGIDVALEVGAPLAWNPSLPGIKLEDTALLGEHGLEVLTAGGGWPTFEHAGLARPLPLGLAGRAGRRGTLYG